MTVQLVSVPPRTNLIGARSSWTKIIVSADCATFNPGMIAAVKPATAKKLLPDAFMLVSKVLFL